MRPCFCEDLEECKEIDKQLSVVAKEGKSIFNFNNIVGVQCYNCTDM